MIDSHCHLADETFASDLDAVIARARGAGLERALVVLEAGNAAESSQAARVLGSWPDVRFAIGVHPHIAGTFTAGPNQAADVVRTQLSQTPAARAVGEIGLDYHYDLAPRAVQQQVFRAQLDLARERDLPVVIHTREAEADTASILEEGNGVGQVRGVLHCFTGTATLAARALELGLYISLAGIVTFPKAGDLRALAKELPLDRLLVETDSPFLAPVPHRGRRNEPALVAHVVAAIAEVRGISAEAVAEQTTANFHDLFRP